ncbi:MAG: SLC26A/SulP transporter family protein [Deltaproteobacteria bacterium]|nr:SLC26A/SulP transporter family protein [Deltaproteobacteria bacterium]
MIRDPDTRAGDLWGGFASMLVALPSAIGYGVTIYAALGPEHAGRGALAGLVGTIALGIVAPRFGGSTKLISAPCGPAALLLAAFAAELAAAAASNVAPPPAEQLLFTITLVGLFASGFQYAYGALGGGRLIKYIPYPVVAGYLSSVGVLLFSKQLPELLGLAKGTGLWAGLFAPSAWSAPGVVVGLVTMAGMLLGPRLTKRVPGVILGLGGGALTYGLLAAFLPELRSLDANPLVVGAVGASPREFVAGLADRFAAATALTTDNVRAVLVPALTLSVLLSIDTLKTGVIVDSLTRSRSDSDRELCGQGLANLASALLGGMPGAGTMGATLVNINSGGRTRRAGIFEGVFALGAFLLFGGLIPGMPNLVGWIPRAALAAIIIVVSLRMIDRHSLELLRHPTTRLDFLVVAAVIVTAVIISPIAAAGVGLALAIMLFTREQIRGSVVRQKLTLGQISSKRQRPPDEVAVLKDQGARVTICRLHGTLFFGTTDQLLTILEADLATCRYLVLDLQRVQSLDYTAAHMLEQIEARLTDRGAYLVFSHLPATLPTGLDLKAYFDQLGLVHRERNVKVFDDLDGAIQWVEDRLLADAGVKSAETGPPLTLAEFELFRGFHHEALAILGAAVQPRHFGPGAAVFRHDDPGDELLLIRRGTVNISLPLDGGRSHLLATFSKGALFGDMAFLDRGRRSADAVAEDEVSIYALSRQRLDELSRRHPDTGAMLFARLARILALRLRQTDAELQAVVEA